MDLILPGSGGAPATAYGSVAQRLLQTNFNIAALRPNDTLRKDEWIQFDQELVNVARQRLNLVADLVSRGLTFTLGNGMGTTVLQWEQISDMNGAERTMDGLSRTNDDRVEFALNSLPIYITHKDFNLNLRALAASRKSGDPLDVTQLSISARKVAEDMEDALINGVGQTIAGNTAYGYTTFPYRNTVEFTAGAWSGGAVTGANILTDVLSMISAAHADRFYGPYVLYVSTTYWLKLLEDFKANSDRTILERIQAIPNITAVKSADFLGTHSVLLVQMTKDVVEEVIGMQPTVVQWESDGGFKLNFKILAIMVPRFRADINGRCGVVHGSNASGGGG